MFFFIMRCSVDKDCIYKFLSKDPNNKALPLETMFEDMALEMAGNQFSLETVPIRGGKVHC